MPFDASDPAFMDPTTRKGEFREVARDIVWKDRQSRKYGPTEDTGGGDYSGNGTGISTRT